MERKLKRKKITLAVRLTALCLIISGFLAIIFTVDFSNPDDLDQYFRNKYEKSAYPGLSVAIVKNDMITYQGYFGYENMESKIPVSKDTLYQIASVSKLVTGTTVMRLWEEGAFKLDDPVNMYLPFEIHHPLYPETDITFRMLLSHTSGLRDDIDPDGSYNGIYHDSYTFNSGGGDSPVSLEEYLASCYTTEGKWYESTLMFTDKEPGLSFSYCNGGYALLGYLVERITGERFNAYSAKSVLNPLGMKDSGWLLSDIDISRLAVPYSNGKALPYYGYASYPDGSFKTTIGDFSKLMIMYMNKGLYKGTRILKESTVDLMFTQQAPDHPQGLSWLLDMSEEVPVPSKNTLIGHGGNDPGIFSLVFYIPETNAACLFFSNTELKLSLRFINIMQIL